MLINVRRITRTKALDTVSVDLSLRSSEIRQEDQSHAVGIALPDQPIQKFKLHGGVPGDSSKSGDLHGNLWNG